MFADCVAEGWDEDDGYCWVGLGEALEWSCDQHTEDVCEWCCVGVEFGVWRKVGFEIT